MKKWMLCFLMVLCLVLPVTVQAEETQALAADIPFAITAQPEGFTMEKGEAGRTLTIGVTAADTSNVTYVWYQDQGFIAEKVGSDPALDISGLGLDYGSHAFYCTVACGDNRVTSEKAVVAVISGGTLAALPENPVYGDTLTAEFSKPEEVVGYNWIDDGGIIGVYETTIQLSKNRVGKRVWVEVQLLDGSTVKSNEVTVGKAPLTVAALPSIWEKNYDGPVLP